MKADEVSHPPLWACRPLGLALALMVAKTVMAAGQSELSLSAPLALPALMHDHLLVVTLFLMIDLFVQLRVRRGGPEFEAVGDRAMWFLLAMALVWVGASVPVAAALGAPASLAELREHGGVLAVVQAGASPATLLGAAVAVGAGLVSPRLLHRAPSRRVVPVAIIVGAVVAVAGPIGRESLSLGGLERDPFAVIIQATWQGLQTITGP